MKEAIDKFSSYNVINYLIPGAAFGLLMNERGLLSLARIDIAGRLIIFYVIVMAISRAGSLIVDPLLKRASLIPRSNYDDYLRASTYDGKVQVLLETSNTYRTMTSACLIGFTLYLATLVAPRAWLHHEATRCVVVGLMGVLFAIAYIKQNKAVTRRVRANTSIGAANDATGRVSRVVG